MPYSNTGPFTNNVTPPGISATFLNNVENFLDTVNTLATDSHNSSDGSGNATIGGNATISGNAVVSGTIQAANNKAFQSKDSGGTVRALMTLDNSNNLIIKSGGNNQIRFETAGGAEQARVDGSGLNLIAGALSLLVGSISRIAFGFGAVTTGGTTITHNLGVNPAAILITPSSNVNAWASSTVTTTTFTAFVSSNTNVWWIAIA